MALVDAQPDAGLPRRAEELGLGVDEIDQSAGSGLGWQRVGAGGGALGMPIHGPSLVAVLAAWAAATRSFTGTGAR